MAKLLAPGHLRVDVQDDGTRVLTRRLVADLEENLGFRKPAKGVKLSPAATTTVTVPVGFDTDYSSIPWGLRNLMGRFDKHDIAGVVHDYLYRIQYPKPLADRAWRLLARAGKTHVNAAQGFFGYWGLRIGAFPAYWARGRQLSANKR